MIKQIKILKYAAEMGLIYRTGFRLPEPQAAVPVTTGLSASATTGTGPAPVTVPVARRRYISFTIECSD